MIFLLAGKLLYMENKDKIGQMASRNSWFNYAYLCYVEGKEFDH